MANPDTPGTKTTEFYLAIMCLVIGVVVMAFGLMRQNDDLVVIGGVIAGGPSAIYSWLRTKLKTKRLDSLLPLLDEVEARTPAAAPPKPPTTPPILPLLLFLLIPALALAGCCDHHIDANAIYPSLSKVLDRHDKYVTNDKALAPVQRDVYLNSSHQLRMDLQVATATSSVPVQN